MTQTKPASPKLLTAIDHILDNPDALSVLMDRMREKADLHVMRGISHMHVLNPARRENARVALILDTETTGLDFMKDSVIQLSMLKVLYDEQGIVEITDEFFDEYNDPGHPLSSEIVRLTGITDEQVKDKKIDPQRLAQFMAGADLFIAHNAAFDRKFVERQFPDMGFDKIDWACSIRDVDWGSRVTGSPKLELLLLQSGYVYPAHNAKADCTATAFMLSRTYDGQSEVMSDIIAARGRQRVMVMATGLPFGRQEPLKAAGWKWSPDRSGDAGDKCWHITVSTPEEAQEAARSAKEAFGGHVMLPVRRMTLRNAYSTRLPPVTPNGFETKNPLKAIGAEDLNIDPNEPQTGFMF